jgi:hypothetical protein
MIPPAMTRSHKKAVALYCCLMAVDLHSIIKSLTSRIKDDIRVGMAMNKVTYHALPTI